MSMSLAACAAFSGAAFVPTSLVALPDATLWLEAAGGTQRLVVATSDSTVLARFSGERVVVGDGTALRCALTGANARALRATLPWLQPRPLGLTASAGFGDRLGFATPGHAQALQQVLASAPGKLIAPVFAQQSIREMTRTQRTPHDVLDDATWGAFQMGWRGPVGADADHVKTTADIDACAAAGYSLYTFDPGEYVDSAADTLPAEAIAARVAALPWATLESSEADLTRRYVGYTLALEDQAVVLAAPEVWRAAAKYGRSIAHAATLYRHLVGLGIPCEVEVSVDETDTPTTLAEHVFIASELARLGMRWVSLAPRFVGRFEKGIDYLGDLADLRRDLAGHAQIARALGPYKLSLHSGSDKFSVYPLFVAATKGVGHLKTAGTSYVEALRVVADADPLLFRTIVAVAREHYPQDRATYHVSAEATRLPDLTQMADAELPALLDNPDLRQIVHVTYGSILAEYRLPLRALLHDHELQYAQTLVRHFTRHLEPFVAASEG